MGKLHGENITKESLVQLVKRPENTEKIQIEEAKSTKEVKKSNATSLA